MKNFIFILALVCLFGSCSKNTLDEEKLETSLSNSKPIVSFDSWDEFHKRYFHYANLSSTELENETPFSLDRDLDVSPAVLAILNDDQEFIVEDTLIWFSEGILYALDRSMDISIQKKNSEYLEEVGKITRSLGQISSSDKRFDKIQMGLNDVDSRYQKQIHRYDYVDNCGTGIHYGPKDRDFKYVYEVLTEYLLTGYQHNYALYFNIKLEYNPRTGRWTGADEKREIIIDVNDYSYLSSSYGTSYGDYSGNPSYYNINKNLYCVGNQSFLLRYYYDIGPIPSSSFWNVSLKGNITQQMIGDSNVNRITTYVNW